VLSASLARANHTAEHPNDTFNQFEVLRKKVVQIAGIQPQRIDVIYGFDGMNRRVEIRVLQN